MIGVIYARYSAGPKQTDQSIEGQVAECQEYAKRNNIDVIEIYADRHVSGKGTEGRFEFQRMLQDAAAKKFEAVIVWKIDRFGRNRVVGVFFFGTGVFHVLFIRLDGGRRIARAAQRSGFAVHFARLALRAADPQRERGRQDETENSGQITNVMFFAHSFLPLEGW